MKHWRKDEQGGVTFALLAIMLIPFVMSLGMGIMISRNVLVRSDLQHALNAATISGAAMTTGTGAGLRINPAAATQTVENIYAANRGQAGQITCIGPGTPMPDGGNFCWGTPYGPPVISANGQQITYTVKEQSSDMGFFSFIGIYHQTYTITSTATLRAAND